MNKDNSEASDNQERLQIWLKQVSLTPQNINAEARKALLELSRENEAVSKDLMHLCVNKIIRASFFEEADIGTMQLFLEVVPLERLSEKMQSNLYRYTMLLLESKQCSLLIKIGHCLDLLERSLRNPHYLREQGLLTYPVEYLLRRPQYLNIPELIKLYYAGNGLRILSGEQKELIEELLSQHLTETSFSLVSEYLLLELLWSLTLQRYHQSSPSVEDYSQIELVDYTEVQTGLIKELFGHLNRSKRLIRSLVWQR